MARAADALVVFDCLFYSPDSVLMYRKHIHDPVCIMVPRLVRVFSFLSIRRIDCVRISFAR